jgi:uncharacterized membrane protein
MTLFEPRTRRAGGALAAALFIAVFPANVTMAITALRSRNPSRKRTMLSFVRLPLQVPLVLGGLAVARSKASNN